MRMHEIWTRLAFLRRRRNPILCAILLAGGGVLQAAQNGFDELARKSLATIQGTLDAPGLGADVQVLRDRWGIPHIYAQNMTDLFFAQGFVQAQDRLWQIDMWRRTN